MPVVTSWPSEAGRENEDAVAVSAVTAAIVDGAGLPKESRAGCHHSVAWYSRNLADRVQAGLALPDRGMRDVLRDAIREVADLHRGTCDLAAGSPSAAIAAWRLSPSHLEFLVLCDCSVLLSYLDGHAAEITDERLPRIVEPEVDAVLRADGAADNLVLADQALHARRAAVERYRNVPGGFWCCTHEPSVAAHALVGRVPLPLLQGVVLASDGATRGLSVLNGLHTLAQLTELALSQEPAAALEAIRRAELRSRETLAIRAIKEHDDATLVSLRLHD